MARWGQGHPQHVLGGADLHHGVVNGDLLVGHLAHLQRGVPAAVAGP